MDYNLYFGSALVVITALLAIGNFASADRAFKIVWGTKLGLYDWGRFFMRIFATIYYIFSGLVMFFFMIVSLGLIGRLISA